MLDTHERRRLRCLRREDLALLQLEALNRSLARAVASPFYREKLGAAPPRLARLDELASLPLTSKEEIVEADAAGAWRAAPDSDYVRFHQTSGTHGRPLPVLDTAEDWAWWIDAWQHVLDAAAVLPGETAFAAFSFGPFIGFWSAFDAAISRGVRVVPGGGLPTDGRLDLLQRSGATLLFATPTYALRLAEEARALGRPADTRGVTRVIVAGEPGGSIPTTRARIERAWAAEVIDHAGATEVGPWGFDDRLCGPRETLGLRVAESHFVAEFLSAQTGRPAGAGELAHLVLTPLGRHGSPVVRYRTGDLVRPRWVEPLATAAEPCGFVRLEGGVLGRADDMLVIRGVNVFPSAIDEILGGFPEVVEHRTTALRRGEMDELVVEVEDHLASPERIARELRVRLGLKVEVRLAPPMSLPRSEGKSRRFLDRRRDAGRESPANRHTSDLP